ncbi:MAG: amidohydrolase family protein [Rhodospirillales bacterium]|jgi:5-methylthioadenosine/S-adenosylhomocysteine deaminase|nr:amidohydrolase family protein [Rhodospirillales bacterium]
MNCFFMNARILTMDDADTELGCANVLVRDGRIAAVGPDVQPPAAQSDIRIIDASGHLLMPGLINGHFHSPGNLLKGSIAGSPLEIFMLYEVPPLQDTPLPPRVNYVRTMIGAMEMLRNGITAVQDDCYHVPIPTRDGIDAIMKAYADSGIRARVSMDQPNVVEYEKYPFLADLIPDHIRREMDDAPRQSTAELVDLYRWFIGRWEGAHGGRIGTAVSCSAPQRVTTEYLAALNSMSVEFNLPHYIHVLETRLQRVLGEEKYGKSPVRYLHDQGVLDERCNIIHSIWVDDDDMDLLAASGCTVAHNPLCNLRLGSGVMPFRRLCDRGIPICLGSDEAISDDAINMWSVAKSAGLVHNLADPDYRNWPDAKEILRCMISGGARAMLRADQTGIVAPGYDADLILLDLDASSFTPLNDLHRQLVYCENGSAVRMTMVAGDIVYENGHLVGVDEDAIKAEARDIVAEFASVWSGGQAVIDRLEPYYREMYLKAAKCDVGMNRRLG